jgi:hypothetical protein
MMEGVLDKINNLDTPIFYTLETPTYSIRWHHYNPPAISIAGRAWLTRQEITVSVSAARRRGPSNP